MLVDDLIASRDLRFLGPGQASFVHDLKKAHRFDLDNAFAAAADELGTTRPTAFERAITLCRPPFDCAWFETSQAARKRFIQAPREGERSIKRIGILMQAIQDDLSTPRWLTRWVGVLAWSFPDGTVSTCGMAMLFDSGDAPHFPEIGPRRSVDVPKDAELGVVAAGQKWSNDPSEIPALARVSQRTLPVPSIYFNHALKNIERERGRRSADQLLERQMGDWDAEQPFWLGVLALLNSRNASIVAPGPDLSKLNKARRKRGQDELLTFSTSKIAPKLKARIDAERTPQGELAGVRAHFVRGHFKVRSSGVFWWSPFLRGDKRLGFADKDYAVIGGKN